MVSFYRLKVILTSADSNPLNLIRIKVNNYHIENSCCIMISSDVAIKMIT